MKMTIVIADDSKTARFIIKQYMEMAGFYEADSIEAENGRVALQKMKEVKPKLLVTDYKMPEMDGLTFVKSLRSNAQYNDVPIIMVTTEAAKKEIVEAIKAGVNDYIVKPFTPDTLKEKLDKVLGL